MYFKVFGNSNILPCYSISVFFFPAGLNSGCLVSSLSVFICMLGIVLEKWSK